MERDFCRRRRERTGRQRQPSQVGFSHLPEKQSRISIRSHKPLELHSDASRALVVTGSMDEFHKVFEIGSSRKRYRTRRAPGFTTGAEHHAVEGVHDRHLRTPCTNLKRGAEHPRPADIHTLSASIAEFRVNHWKPCNLFTRSCEAFFLSWSGHWVVIGRSLRASLRESLRESHGSLLSCERTLKSLSPPSVLHQGVQDGERRQKFRGGNHQLCFSAQRSRWRSFISTASAALSSG